MTLLIIYLVYLFPELTTNCKHYTFYDLHQTVRTMFSKKQKLFSLSPQFNHRFYSGICNTRLFVYIYTFVSSFLAFVLISFLCSRKHYCKFAYPLRHPLLIGASVFSIRKRNDMVKMKRNKCTIVKPLSRQWLFATVTIGQQVVNQCKHTFR